MTYETDRLFEEVSYVAYHFHWPMDTILDLEHPLRLRFVEDLTQEEIAAQVGVSQVHVSRILRAAVETLRANVDHGEQGADGEG